MEKLLLILSIMPVVTLVVHLGLTREIAKVLAKVLGCHKCLTFWLTVIVMYANSCNAYTIIPAAIGGAYLSEWFGLLLIKLNHKYLELWQRLNNKQPKQGK